MAKQQQETIWYIDPVHTKIGFKTKYLMLTSISGWFQEFEGIVMTDDHFNPTRIQLTIYTNSLITGNEERDNHLRSADFFDSKKFPIISFNSTSILTEDASVEVTGQLGVKDIRATISFNAAYLGFTNDPLGNVKAGFEMNIPLSRKDFDMSWNQFFDKSGVLLSDEVIVFCDVQLLKIT
jgi:polyisoprenoid-binding protein YceI